MQASSFSTQTDRAVSRFSEWSKRSRIQGLSPRNPLLNRIAGAIKSISLIDDETRENRVGSATSPPSAPVADRRLDNGKGGHRGGIRAEDPRAKGNRRDEGQTTQK
tara:strand:+ start:809 stop:1126 length:318 start_codon:yes stop_codon:yes gene_type:complete